jgi:transcriptional regulator with XRE-family HTH domain
MSDANRREFADFLRSRRQRLDPATMGLATLRRRRTPGLRREEVAELAGIGVDWYIRLEQGRAVSPSAATLDALAAALRLSAAERAHLNALARSGERPPFAPESVPEPVRLIVAGMNLPAYVTGRRWDVLAWNAAAADLLKDFGAVPPEDRNILLYTMLDPEARRRFGPGWEQEARRIVALFRTTHDLWAGDPAFAALLARLNRESPDFASWWERHDIRNTAAGVKTLHHPERGAQRFHHASFQVNEEPGLRLVIYTPIRP